jgi:N utilization substance protein A
VGLRGIRIQNIVNELNGERIDVVQWDPDPAAFVANALSPAQVQSVRILEDGLTAEAIVADRQLSLAIGKEGQNARLAAKLTGLRIDIKSLSAVEEMGAEAELQISAEPDVKRETTIWEELAQQEQEAAARAAELVQQAAAAAPEREPATLEPEIAVPVAEQVPAQAPSRAGAVRFADEVLPPTPAAGAPVPGAGLTGTRRRGGGGRRGGGRDEEARGRRGVPGGRRGGVSRRSLDEEIEEELEAALEGEDFDFFGLKDEDEDR